MEECRRVCKHTLLEKGFWTNATRGCEASFSFLRHGCWTFGRCIDTGYALISNSGGVRRACQCRGFHLLCHVLTIMPPAQKVKVFMFGMTRHQGRGRKREREREKRCPSTVSLPKLRTRKSGLIDPIRSGRLGLHNMLVTVGHSCFSTLIICFTREIEYE